MRTFLPRISICLAVLFLGMLFSSNSMAEDTLAAARLVSIEGKVDFQIPNGEWLRAAAGQSLPPGTTVRTGPYARASLLLADETLIRLNRNTEFTLSKIPPKASWLKKIGFEKRLKAVEKAVSRLKKGEIWLLNKDPNAAIDIVTPRSHVGIRGTEIAIRIADDETERVVVLEGAVNVANEHGAVSLGAGEEAITRPGSAPQKRIILQPEDAVQWTIVIPPLFMPRDFVPRSAGMNRDADPGWVLLDEGRYQQAREYFAGISNPDAMTLAGRIAAFVGVKNFYQAFNTLDSAQARYPDIPVFDLQRAWLELLTGDIATATRRTEGFIAKNPDNPLGWELFSLANLVLNKKKQALQTAEKAAALDRQSPTPLILISYAYQAFFDLDSAAKSVQAALELDSTNITALHNLARLQFGRGYTRKALQTIENATTLAPENSEVNNLKGFILLASQQTDASIEAFSKSIADDSGLAEPHLGLGLAMMRRGDADRAMEEITTAVLLEPRRSLFRSYWAKILYQLGRRHKALDVLDIAKNIDPNDPSPELYRAIILRDLNRPFEAITALNHAIAMNDNRAVYRSRFLLDQDLAVKNVDLAQLYNQLGVSDWAGNKAATSVRDDYANASAHLFYAGALNEYPERSWARNSENLKARLLMPANINSFNSYNEYTSFLEKPNIDTEVYLEGGNKSYFSKALYMGGAVPQKNLAFMSLYSTEKTNGWRDTNYFKKEDLVGYLKWDATPKDSFMLVGAIMDNIRGDKASPLFEHENPAEPRDRQEGDVNRLEVGYHHNFSPGTDLLLHYIKISNRTDQTSYTPGSLTVNWLPPITYNGNFFSNKKLHKPFHQIQSNLLATSGSHQYILGTIHYIGETINTQQDLLSTVALGNIAYTAEDRQPSRAHSYFIHDIFQITPNLTIEAALYWDKMDTSFFLVDNSANSFSPTWTSSSLVSNWELHETSPRVGLAWSPNNRHTVRLAAFRYLLPFNGDRLEPVDIAGVPIWRNGFPGSITEEADLVWEYEWDKAFCSANIFYMDRKYPIMNRSGATLLEWDSRSQGIDLRGNLLFKHGLGLNTGYAYKKFYDEFNAQSTRNEHQGKVGLKWVHPSGLSAGALEIFRQINYKSASFTNETIWLTDLEATYEFPDKKGAVRMQINNLFDQEFNWYKDDFIFEGEEPAREVFLLLELYF